MAKVLPGYQNESPISGLSIEEISSTSIHFLVVLVYKGPSFRTSGRLDFKVAHKPTAIWQPLTPSSQHPMYVHRSWPTSMIHRIRGLCSEKNVAEEEINIFCLGFGGVDATSLTCTPEAFFPNTVAVLVNSFSRWPPVG